MISPVVLHGKKDRKTLLVTAGMDGDEYAGIEAAKQLVYEFRKKPFRGKLIIVPVVNMSGYETGLSQNPDDGLFPKYIFPGKKNGKPTERLCWEIFQLAQKSDFWLDVHGGATTEMLEPFVGSWKSGNTVIDDRVFQIIRSMKVRYAVFENAIVKTETLAKVGCGYLLTESGQLGKTEEADVQRHIMWAYQVMGALGMIDVKSYDYPKQIYGRMTEYVTGCSGRFKSNFRSCKEVKKGEVIGFVESSGGIVCGTVVSRLSGRLLWIKTDSYVRTGEVVAGAGDVLL